MTITWPESTVKDKIDEIRDAIGRPVTFQVKHQGTACPDCTLDPITGQSLDPFCGTCGGAYWTNTISGYVLSGHIRWRSSEMPSMYPGGVIPEGDCTVTVEFTELSESYINRAKNVIVDDKVMQVKNYALRGVPNPNRLRITLLEEGNE